MPARSSRDTLVRQWELLKLLPSSGSGKSIRELTESLNGMGFPVSARQVERDLRQLEGVMPIEGIGTRPYGWRWIKGSSRYVASISLPEALSWQLVADSLHPLLPRSMLVNLEPHFREAADKLEAMAAYNPAAGWRDRVRVVTPALPVIPPKIPDSILEPVQNALLLQKQLLVTYRSYGSSESHAMTLHPLGLIQRGPASYLAATVYNYRDVRLLALHRIETAEELAEAATVPPDFQLDKLIENGMGQFGDGEWVTLEARVHQNLAKLLDETKLSADQTLIADGENTFRLTVRLINSWQLKWWILSQGDDIEVLGPASLREEIRKTLKMASRQYNKQAN